MAHDPVRSPSWSAGREGCTASLGKRAGQELTEVQGAGRNKTRGPDALDGIFVQRLHGDNRFFFGVERDTGRASSGILEMDLQDVVEDMALAIRPEHKALVVFIDEMQDLDDDLLEALVTVQHATGQRELPFFVIGAGLPNLPARLADVRSYAERLFEYRTIGRLPDVDARESMEGPARQMGQSYMRLEHSKTF